jgi:hypothetical protein
LADKSKHDRAEAEFKKTRADAGKTAADDYGARSLAVQEKTARLRALRLAKEAADMEAKTEKKSDTPNHSR